MKTRLFFIALVAAAFTACSDAPTAERVLRAAGYSNINIEGWGWFGCAEDDAFNTKFTAVGPTGVPVSGVVCSGWLKGATIRID